MPDGATHAKYHTLGFIPLVASTTAAAIVSSLFLMNKGDWWVIAYILELWFWVLFWYYAGRYIDPDWDQVTMTKAEGNFTRELGLLGAFMYGYSSFYAALMNYFARKLGIKGGIAGAHRTWLTHSPIGTLIRMGFINAPLVYAYNIAKIPFAYFDLTLMLASTDIAVFLLAQLVGLGIADGIHVILDMTYGEN